MRTSFLMLETALQFARPGRTVRWARDRLVQDQEPPLRLLRRARLARRPRARARALREDPGSLSRSHRAGSLAVLPGRAARPPLFVRRARGGDGRLPPLRRAAGRRRPRSPWSCRPLRDAAEQRSPRSERIACRFGIEIEAVLPTACGGWKAVGMALLDRSSWQAAGDIVVNCLWDGRLQGRPLGGPRSRSPLGASAQVPPARTAAASACRACRR